MENCSSLEPWMFRPTFDEPRWIGDSFERDNEALTRALQISLSDDSSTSAAAAALSSPDAAAASFLFHHLIKPEPSYASASAAYDPVSSKRGRGASSSPSGKITKRKSRASRRSPTTYIAADPANFRQMVQRVTGIRLAGDPAAELPVDQILRPEPHRCAAAVEGFLPTLDTSAFLLDRACNVGPGSGSGPVGPAPVELDGYDFGSFPSFPTLESWSGM